MIVLLQCNPQQMFNDYNTPSCVIILTFSTLGFITVVSTVVLSIADVTAHHTVAIITLVLK